MPSLDEVANTLHIGDYHRHVFLCVGDKCCSTECGEEAWVELKKLLKDRNLSLSTGPNACYRTKVGCLRVCQDGPIAVVYPEGTYYCGLSAERVPQFVESHLIGVQQVEECVFARNPLPLASATTPPSDASA